MDQKAKFGIKKREKGINVTPFVDVLLVVLVIFILTSNASIPGIEVNLPKASNSVALEKPKTKAITIDPSGQVFLLRYTRAALRSDDPEFYSTCTYILDTHLVIATHSCSPASHSAAAAVLLL